MSKKTKLMIICLFFIPCLFSLSFAQQDETITIATYYPSPYGVYKQLQTNSFGVGDNDGDGSLDDGDVPTTAGDVWISGNVGIGTTNPQAGLEVSHGLRLTPTTLPAGVEGELRYDTSRKNLYYRSDSRWKPLVATVSRSGSMQNSDWLNVGQTWTASGPVYVQAIRNGGFSGASYYCVYLNGNKYVEAEAQTYAWLPVAADCDNGSGGCTVQFTACSGSGAGNYIVYYFSY
jgi:hypothetical protein